MRRIETLLVGIHPFVCCPHGTPEMLGAVHTPAKRKADTFGVIRAVTQLLNALFDLVSGQREREHHEFIAARAVDLAALELHLQGDGGIFQEHIAGEMPVLVVDLLEIRKDDAGEQVGGAEYLHAVQELRISELTSGERLVIWLMSAFWLML